MMTKSSRSKQQRARFITIKTTATVLLTLSSSSLSVNASWHKHSTSHHIRPKTITCEILNSIRAGSESTSAWSAGSKYDYRSPKYSPYGRSSSSQSMNQQRSYPITSAEDETKEAIASAFLNRDNRNRFIARVYALLSGQLLFTTAIIQLFHTNPNIRDYLLYTNSGRKIPLLSVLLSSISLFLITASINIRQSNWRWPLFLLFTVGQAIPVGFISSLYAYATVIKALSTTAAVTGGITLYTLLQKNPKYDLSQWGRALSGLGMAFLLYGVVHVLELFGVLPAGFLPYSEAIYCVFGAGLFSLYLAHHTRLIVAGKSAKYRMSEKDYILGAMSLYSDIVDIFLYVLRVLGDMDD